MLLSDIYNTAAALISEAPDGADNADLKDKAVFLLYQIISLYLQIPICQK